MLLVIHPAVEPERLQRIEAAAGPGLKVVNVEDEKDVAGHMPQADAFFGKLRPHLLSLADRLRWVQCPTASLEHYMFDELVEHPCTLTNMRGIYSDVIADQVLGYILCVARNLHIYIRRQMDARWEAVGGEAERTGHLAGPGTSTAIDRAHGHLADSTLGIVGMGGIGREVARLAAAHRMRVLAVDPRPDHVPGEVEKVWPPEQIDEMLGQCDYVVIAAPHTPQSKGLLHRQRLRAMKPSAWLINVGRGAIVKLVDLEAALDAGELAGAALDVMEVEPLPPDSSLWRRENVIITPHMAGVSPRIAERHLAVLLENIGHFIAGEPLVNVVDKKAWF